MSVVIETTIGDITVDLFTEERPRTCLNFLKLCKSKYYNLNLIFSIQRNFIAQMGDPTGTGQGGDSLFSQLYGNQARFYEGEKSPIIKHQDVGTLSMVNCGENHIFGSQFFITLGENLDSLDSVHLVFGKVAEGMDIVSKLNETITDGDNRPYKDIRITHTVILHDPFPNPKDYVFPNESPEPSRDILESIYIAIDEDIDDNDGMDAEEVAELDATKEANARAVVLEMVGDLPEADMAPPENVLFVCKLNPVTTSEDMMIIFSRFGKINSCEVICDKKTGNSLQYAFIEFSETKSCEDAYFKMDNVLIDERRIHVDFSQSVSTIKWKGKGRIEYYDDDGKRTNAPKDADDYNAHKKSNRHSAPNRADHFNSSKDKCHYSESKRADRYSDSKRADHYSDSKRADHYSDSKREDHYSDSKRTGHYSDSKRPDHYSGSKRTDHYSGSKRPDHYSDSKRSDYSRSKRADYSGSKRADYSESKRTDHYSDSKRTDHYSDSKRAEHYSDSKRADHNNAPTISEHKKDSHKSNKSEARSAEKSKLKSEKKLLKRLKKELKEKKKDKSHKKSKKKSSKRKHRSDSSEESSSS